MHKKLFQKLLSPRSRDEDSERREFILNVLLISSILLFSLASVMSFIVSVTDPGPYERNSVSIILLILTLFFFLALYNLSRKGFFNWSAHILVMVFFSFAFLMGYRWGVDVNASLLIYALVIVMAGILVSTRFAFLITGLVAVSLLAFGHLQSENMLETDRYWRTLPWETSDTVMTIIIFLVIAIVSWLSNREIERSLLRAHRSEDSLRRERDLLEVTVEERTRELREAQMEKISQLYNLAEFGRLSSGLFHDLMNPLTAVSLNMEKAKKEDENATGELSKAQYYLERAFVAAKRMEKFIIAVRKHMGKSGTKKKFSLQEETEQVVDILSYKARRAGVDIVLSNSENNENTEITGDPVEWSQIMLNLISNAIDAYDEIPKEEKEKSVVVLFVRDGKNISCTVTDRGIGIPKENMDKIFEPYFTTKAENTTKGMGIGLYLVRRMVEKSFGGRISAESAPGLGTIFRVVLPE